jgi:hypothetical protein
LCRPADKGWNPPTTFPVGVLFTAKGGDSGIGPGVVVNPIIGGVHDNGVYGFREVYGSSPMAYLKTLRLYAVRTQLQQAEATTTAIAEIAKRFGFRSLGHFSRDYKTMFGELPSETLKHPLKSFDSRIFKNPLLKS